MYKHEIKSAPRFERKEANPSAPSITEVASKVEALGSAWEQFKQKNDETLNELKKKGTVDPLNKETLDRINTAIDEAKSRLDKVETAASRPNAAAEGKEKADEAEHKRAFNGYLRKGIDAGLADIQVKTMSVGSDPDGGYLVTPTMSNQIITKVFETSPLRQLATIETITSDSLDIIDDHDEASVETVSETGTRNTTNTPIIAKRNIPVHEISAMPKATQKLLDDAGINIEAWLSAKVADKIGRTENTYFISGNGVGKPRGILNYAAGTSWGQIQQVSSGVSGAFVADTLIDLVYSLKTPYANGAAFLMTRASEGKVRQLKDGSGRYLWEPSLAAGKPGMLLGYELYQAADMEEVGASSLSAAFGNFKQGYTIVDRRGITILRDPFTDKPFVKFYTTKRVGGDVTNFEAIKIYKLA